MTTAIVKTRSGWLQDGPSSDLAGSTTLADQNHVLGPAAAGQTETARATERMQITAGGARTVRLPLEAESEGREIWFTELGGAAVTLQSSAGAPIGTFGNGVNNPTSQTVLCQCDGIAWRACLLES